MFSVEIQEKKRTHPLVLAQKATDNSLVRQIKRKKEKIHVFHSPVRQLSFLNTTLVQKKTPNVHFLVQLSLEFVCVKQHL